MTALAMTRAAGTPAPDTFVEEILQHLDVLGRVAQRLTRHTQDAEDLVQETVARALARRTQFAPGTNLRAWLLAIERSLFISAYRHARRGPHTQAMDDLEESLLYGRGGLTPSPSAESDLLQEWTDPEVVAALAALPEYYRTAVVLSDVQGLSYAQIMGRMGWPLGTLTSRLHRGRALLRRALGDQGRMPTAPRASRTRQLQPLAVAA
jgi:RNA polymerase sigma-70 factor (ECF subfamily)